MKRIPAISLSYGEGRYFDLWMLVHGVGGVAGGLSNVFFGLSTTNVYLLGVLLMVAWEILEYATGIRESPVNRVIDVAVGLLGIAGALWLAGLLDTTAERIAFLVSGFGFGLGGLLGWRARQKRARTAEALP
jgi:hypothetical protein